MPAIRRVGRSASGKDSALISFSGARALLNSGACSAKVSFSISSFSAGEFSTPNRWLLGGTDGLDWTNPQVSSGSAFGTQTGSNGFDDGYAELKWVNVADAEIITKVFNNSATGIHEIEHHHRGTTSAHFSTRYEINFAHDGQYVDFVRWLGPIGHTGSDFVYLVPSGTYGIPGGLSTGDLVRTRMVGDTITAWYNRGAGWVLINTSPVTDTAGTGGHAVLSSGHTGAGWYRELASSSALTYGISDYSMVQL